MRLYLDTAPVIYTVEDVPIYAQAVDNCLAVPEIVAMCFSLTISDLIDLKRSVLKLSSHPENLIFALKHRTNDSWAA